MDELSGSDGSFGSPPQEQPPIDGQQSFGVRAVPEATPIQEAEQPETPIEDQIRNAQEQLKTLERQARTEVVQEALLADSWARQQNIVWTDERNLPVLHHYTARDEDGTPLRLVVTYERKSWGRNPETNPTSASLSIREYVAVSENPDQLGDNYRGTTTFEYGLLADGRINENGRISVGRRSEQTMETSATGIDFWSNTDFRGRNARPIQTSRRTNKILASDDTTLLGREIDPSPFKNRAVKLEPARPANAPQAK